jgi:peptidyl-prolyl cis-trans isomerase SurA
MSLPVAAVYQPIDTIIATVSNDVITQSDLDKKVAVVKENFLAQGQPLPAEKEIIKQVLDRLIIESLQLQMAEQSGLQITDERLAQTMKKVAERKNMTEEQFRTALEKEGIPYEDMREQIRKDLTLQQLQQSRLRQKIQINEQEVNNYLESAEGQKLTDIKYLMSHIVLEVPEGASNSDAEKTRETLADIRQNILQGKYTFNEIQAGKDINGYTLKGNQLDWMPRDALPSLFANTLKSLKKGDISTPVRSGAGWHLILLSDVSGSSSEIVHQISSRHILIKPSEVRDNEQTRKLANDLFIRIKNGEDFTLLAKEYSEDPGSALQGGNLGWSAPSQFVKDFAATLKKLQKDEISQPFQTEFGWHILQKLDERDHDMTLENQKNQAYQAIYERKFADELEAWLITIREEAFIEIKNQDGL